MRVSLRGCLCLVFVTLALAGCAEKPLHDDMVERSVLCLPAGERWVPVDVEIAATPEARRDGLSGRSRLATREGMLFLYLETQPPDNSFWMFNTRMALEIAFMDSQGTVVAMRSMRPCIHEDSSKCPEYPAGAPHHAALEVNDGLLEQLGIEVGDRIMVSPNRDANACEQRKAIDPDFFSTAR